MDLELLASTRPDSHPHGRPELHALDWWAPALNNLELVASTRPDGCPEFQTLELVDSSSKKLELIILIIVLNSKV